MTGYYFTKKEKEQMEEKGYKIKECASEIERDVLAKGYKDKGYKVRKAFDTTEVRGTYNYYLWIKAPIRLAFRKINEFNNMEVLKGLNYFAMKEGHPTNPKKVINYAKNHSLNVYVLFHTKEQNYYIAGTDIKVLPEYILQ